MNHLENDKLSRKDNEDVEQLNKTLIEFKNLLDGHATSNTNYSRNIGLDLYARNFYNLLILDELIDGEYCNINSLRNKISHKFIASSVAPSFIKVLTSRIPSTRSLFSSSLLNASKCLSIIY